jgi:hypothetical protein
MDASNCGSVVGYLSRGGELDFGRGVPGRVMDLHGDACAFDCRSWSAIYRYCHFYTDEAQTDQLCTTMKWNSQISSGDISPQEGCELVAGCKSGGLRGLPLPAKS